MDFRIIIVKVLSEELCQALIGVSVLDAGYLSMLARSRVMSAGNDRDGRQTDSLNQPRRQIGATWVDQIKVLDR